MITGAIKSQVDKVWDAFWSGGVSNPLTVIEQITYLLFAKRLESEAGADRAKQVELAFQLCYSRIPQATETAAATRVTSSVKTSAIVTKIVLLTKACPSF